MGTTHGRMANDVASHLDEAAKKYGAGREARSKKKAFSPVRSEGQRHAKYAERCFVLVGCSAIAGLVIIVLYGGK